MIIEGSKNYGTGEVLMISDGDATEREVWDWLRENYGMHPNDGYLEKQEKSEYHEMINPATFTFRANAKDTKMLAIGTHPVVSPTYHQKETCNNCGSLNEIKRTEGEDGVTHECETKCTCCGFRDYWAHGFFESMQDGYDACEKYPSHA